jgi:hypothetical protein
MVDDPCDANASARDAVDACADQRPSSHELKRILARHRGWLEIQQASRPDDLPPNIYQEELKPLSPEWRNEALRSPAQAILFNANLTDAILSGANLSMAILIGARPRGANLSHADLSWAKLSRADLLGADLTHADLSMTVLRGAKLAATKLANATLTKANYAPASEPPHPYVVGIKGLSTVVVPAGEEVGLVQLRKLLQEAGLRDLERETTYSIERAKTSEMRGFPAVIGVIFRRAAFEWPTAYGLHPFRAPFLIMVIWLLGVPVYCWSIVNDPAPSEQGSGIYRTLPANRIVGPASEPQIEKEPKVLRVQATDWWNAIPPAAYFSLLSAVNIGFEQFTPGDWIRRLQPHDYELQAEGWTRVVSGVQALLSVFLLAMWVLTQFGRPFQ